MTEHKRLPNVNRNVAPCKDCGERFTACSDRCPKDLRGEYGYKAWKAENYKIKKAEREYLKNSREDYLRSELREEYTQRYVRSRYRVDLYKGKTRSNGYGK